MHTGSIPVGPTIQQQQQEKMRQPNPLDPLDDVKRWFADLWPVERAAAVLLGIAVITVLVLWAVR